MKTFNLVKIVLVLALSLGIVTMGGCAKTAIPNHPGAVNPVDNALYDGILTARAAIESAKVQFAGNNATLTAVNAIIPGFNKLEAGYSAYHTALVAGKADPAALTELQNELSAVKAALASVLKVATPGPVVPTR